MFSSIINYFESLNNAGQALFIVGMLLVITFIILLIVVFKPEKKAKKIYGESPLSDKENLLLEKLKNIDNISDDDINIENDKTKNLKNIVDELKGIEEKEIEEFDVIQKYEDEQENTAVISVNELLKATKTYNNDVYNEKTKEDINNVDKDLIDLKNIEPPKEHLKFDEEKIHNPKKEVFSSVFSNNTKENNNEEFLNSLKEFRNNL